MGMKSLMDDYVFLFLFIHRLAAAEAAAAENRSAAKGRFGGSGEWGAVVRPFGLPIMGKKGGAQGAHGANPGGIQPPGPSSLFIFTDDTRIRRCTRFIIEWPPFEYAVLLTIIANCIVLALEEHQPEGDKTVLAKNLVSWCLFSILFPAYHHPNIFSLLYAALV